MLLWYGFKRRSIDNLIKIEHKNTIAMAHLLFHSIYSKHKTFLSSASKYSDVELSTYAETQCFNKDQLVQTQTTGITVRKLAFIDHFITEKKQLQD